MDPVSPFSQEIARGVCRKILSGPTFSGAPRLSRLLEQCVDGAALNEEQRGELKRLGRKLDDYYAAEGAGDPVRVAVSAAGGGVRWDVRDASVDLAAWVPPAPVVVEAKKSSWIPYVAGILLLLTAGAWWYTRTPAVAPGEIKGLAVLPLEDSRPLPEQDGLVDGLGAALALELSHIEGLRVPEYSSSAQYKYRFRELGNLKSTLGADGIVEGVMRVGQELVEGELWIRRTSDGARIWSGNFRSSRAELLNGVDAASKAIAEAVGKSLPARAMLGTGKPGADATKLYLQALASFLEGPKEMEKSYRALGAAEAAAPKLRAGMSASAELWGRILMLEYRPVPEAVGKAREYAKKALEQDKESAEAHLAQGLAAVYGDWDWAGARKEYQEALALRPNYALAIHAMAHLERALGRPDEALKRMQEAYALDPYRSSMNLELGLSYVFNRQYDDALNLMSQYEKQDPYNNVIRLVRGLAYLGKGNWSAVDSHVGLLVNEEGFEPPSQGILGVSYARAGRRDAALKVLKRLEEMNADKDTPIDGAILAAVQLAVGQTAEAYKSLNRAVENRSTLLLGLAVNPLFDGARDQAQFKVVLAKMGIRK